MVLTDILTIVLGGGAVVAIIEWIRYKRLDKANAKTVETSNVELSSRNNAIALEADNKILLSMQSRIESLIEEATKYSNELKLARKEIHELSLKVDHLASENKFLREELKRK